MVPAADQGVLTEEYPMARMSMRWLAQCPKELFLTAFTPLSFNRLIQVIYSFAQNNPRFNLHPHTTVHLHNINKNKLNIYATCTAETYYLLTPCCRVLLEKLTGVQLVKKFPVFYGTRRFITALTSVRHLSLSWASPIQAFYICHT